MGHDDAFATNPDPIPVIAMAGICVRSLPAGPHHSLALSWEQRVFFWCKNKLGQLGHGDRLGRHSAEMVDGLEGVGRIATASEHSLTVTHPGHVFRWGDLLRWGGANYVDSAEERPITVEGFGGMRVTSVRADSGAASSIGEDGEPFSWGRGKCWRLSHGDREDHIAPHPPTIAPKRVEALRGVGLSVQSHAQQRHIYRVRQWRASHGAQGSSGRPVPPDREWCHTIAVTKDGLVHVFGGGGMR